MKRGYKCCPSCSTPMLEHVDERLDDYWRCPTCFTKIRIFHKRIEASEPEDYPTGHA